VTERAPEHIRAQVTGPGLDERIGLASLCKHGLQMDLKIPPGGSNHTNGPEPPQTHAVQVHHTSLKGEKLNPIFKDLSSAAATPEKRRACRGPVVPTSEGHNSRDLLEQVN
jgi:hypothetical protein